MQTTRHQSVVITTFMSTHRYILYRNSVSFLSSLCHILFQFQPDDKWKVYYKSDIVKSRRGLRRHIPVIVSILVAMMLRKFNKPLWIGAFVFSGFCLFTFYLFSDSDSNQVESVHTVASNGLSAAQITHFKVHYDK